MAKKYVGAVLALCSWLAPAQSLTIPQTLARIGSEADRFAELAPNIRGAETLRQTTSTGAVHTVISEYGFLKLASGIREVRQVATVDGHKVKHPKGLQSLAAAIAADDEKSKRKLLESFERLGLQGVATDFGPLILVFAHGNTQQFEFSGNRPAVNNGERLSVLRFQQLDGSQGLTVYTGDKPVKQKLNGEIWVRQADGLPLRITIDSTHDEGRDHVRDAALVDYRPGPADVLLPVLVVHRQFRNGRLTVQDAFRYSNYAVAGGKPQ